MRQPGLSLIVRLREGRYDAAAVNPSVAEWPPHPARLFCALVAAAMDADDRAVLSWLERQEPPEVWSTTQMSTSRSSGYVVTNRVGGSGHQTWPGRTSGRTQRVGALPADDTYAVVWPLAEPDNETIGRLVRLAGRVPHVGRSTSTVDVSVAAGVPASRPGWVCHRPVALGTAEAVELRVPYSGYLDALTAAYERGDRSWQAPARTLAYSPQLPEAHSPTSVAAVDGPFGDLLVWGIARPSVPISSDRVLSVAECLRKAVLARITDPIPAQVCGHGANGRPHVAYLGLVDVGHDRADGHVLGVGVAVPADMNTNDRKALLRGLLGPSARDPMTELRLQRGMSLTLEYSPEGRWGLRAQRWQHPGGCRSWLTATPLMLDRFMKRRSSTDVADAIATALVTAGYPQPAEVQPLTGPAVVGAANRLRPDSLGSRPRRPTLHCRVTFDQPVRGPVVAGATRYIGGGLFVPDEGFNSAVN